MSNVKPGDLARIIHPDMYGKLVSVFYMAPKGTFVLPDGMRAISRDEELCWVFQFIGSPERAPMTNGATRLACYAVCGDRWLRPLLPDVTPEATRDEQSAPAPSRAIEFMGDA